MNDIADTPVKKSPGQKAFALLPTLLTLGNAVCGFGAITILARVGPMFEIPPDGAGDGFDPAAQLFNAALLIFLAMLFDALDGSAARLTNQTSEFGAMLDSLCDVVSFGVAPAFMMLKLTDARYGMMDTLRVEGTATASDASLFQAPFYYDINVLWAIAALYLACAILRLARFNVETDEEDDHDGFSGLPSPAAAAVVASFPIGVWTLKTKMALVDENGEALVRWAEPAAHILFPSLAVLLPLITLATAVLMVSRIKYPHVFNQMLRGRRGRKQLLQLVFTLALVFAVGGMTAPVIFCWFAFAGPLQAVWSRMRKRRQKPDKGDLAANI